MFNTLPYQQSFINDPAPHKILVHARRVGGTFAGLALAREYVARGQRVLWIGPHGLRGVDCDPASMPREIKIVDYNLDEIRGHAAHVIMDSPNCYHGEDWHSIWNMVSWHVTTPTLARPTGYGMTVITNLDHLVLKTIDEHSNRDWSTHVIPIHDAIKDGFPNVDLTSLTERTLRKEYMAGFNVPNEGKFKAVYDYAKTWA